MLEQRIAELEERVKRQGQHDSETFNETADLYMRSANEALFKLLTEYDVPKELESAGSRIDELALHLETQFNLITHKLLKSRILQKKLKSKNAPENLERNSKLATDEREVNDRLFQIGVHYLVEDEFELAISHFNLSLLFSSEEKKGSEDPSGYKKRLTAAIYQHLGEAKSKLEKYEDAIKDFSRAIEFHNNSTPYLYRAEANRALGKEEEAQVDLAMYNALSMVEASRRILEDEFV